MAKSKHKTKTKKKISSTNNVRSSNRITEQVSTESISAVADSKHSYIIPELRRIAIIGSILLILLFGLSFILSGY